MSTETNFFSYFSNKHLIIHTFLGKKCACFDKRKNRPVMVELSFQNYLSYIQLLIWPCENWAQVLWGRLLMGNSILASSAR